MESSLLFKIDWGEHIRLFTVVSPQNSPLSLLTFQGVILTKNERLAFRTEENEITIFGITGKAVLLAADKRFEIGREDMLYVGSGYKCELVALTNFRGVFAGAPSPKQHPIRLIKRSDIEGTKYHQFIGKEPYLRENLFYLTPEIEAARLMAGVTIVKPGNWSSWPPHDHGAKLEELYFFYHMPYPAFGFQMVYETLENAKVYLIRENDGVVIPSGYHPNVVIPNYEMRYLWVLVARKPYEDRVYGKWTVDPIYEKIVRVRV